MSKAMRKKHWKEMEISETKHIFMSRSPRQRELKPIPDLWDQGTIFNMVENSHSQGQGSWGVSHHLPFLIIPGDINSLEL